MKNEVTVVVETSVTCSCAKCGKPLEASANGSEIDIEPCETCMEDAKQSEDAA